MNSVKRIPIGVALTTAAFLISVAPTPIAAPARAATQTAAVEGPVYDLTAEQWREDLRFMAGEIRSRHKNPYHAVSKAEFDAAVAALDARIPSLQRNEIIVGMMRIAAMVGDGHTRVDPRKDMRFGFRSLPLRLYLFDDGLYVRAAAPSHSTLAGARILAIGGVPADEAIARADAIIAKDNAMATKLAAPIYLNMPDILHALKLSPRRDAAVLKLQKGKRVWTETVPAGEIAPPWPDDTDGSFITPEGWADARTTAAPPLWLQAPLDFHRMVAIPERKTLYTQLNEVTGIDGQSLGDFGVKIRQAAERTNPKNIVIDLRLNFGGNWDLRNTYVRELIKAEDEDTQLFVLSGRGSFSATEAILVDLRRLSKAAFIGEPASSRPNSFGDGYRSRMPNSQIAIQTSIQWNQLSGQSKVPWTGVHIATPYAFADYAAGRDPALEAVFTYTPPPLLAPTLIAAAKAGGREAAIRALDDYLATPAYRYLNFASIVPGAADALLRAKQPDAALAVAQRAARDYPDSLDAWIILAFVADGSGHPDIALAAARRTVAIDPNNRPIRNLLAKLAT